MYNLLPLCFLILVLFSSTVLSSNAQNSSAQNSSAQNSSAQNSSAQNSSAQNSSAQNSSTPIFRKTTQPAEGPKIIDPNLRAYLVLKALVF
jgi:hypothetical protein